VRYFQEVWDFLATRPALLALVISVLFSWGAALWAERVVFNPQIGKRRLQQASLLVTTVSCLTFALLLWPVFDPTTNHRVRFVVALGTALCAPFLYAFLTKWFGARWPWLSSVFTNPLADATGTLRTLSHQEPPGRPGPPSS